MNQSSTYSSENKSSQEISRDIYRTQDRIDNRLHELRDELTTDKIIGAVLSKFGINSYEDGVRVAGSKAQGFKSAIKRNPTATALISSGAFVGILNSLFDNFKVEDAFKSGLQKGQQGSSKIGDGITSLKDSISNFGQQTSDRISGAHDRASSGLSDGTSALGDKAQTAKEAASEKAAQAGQYTKENPLAVGLGLFAVGVAISTLAPRTRTEDELIGEKADQLKQQATHKAAEAVSETREKAKVHGERIKAEETEDNGLAS